MANETVLSSDKLKGFTTECDCLREGTITESTGRLVHKPKYGPKTDELNWFMEYHCPAHQGPFLVRSPDAHDAIREVLRDNGVLPT